MKPRDGLEFLLLAALWGGSYLFMRVAAPEFGPVALIALRVAIAAACLLPVLWLRGGFGELKAHAGPIAVVGLISSALPFVLIAYALLSVTAGFAAILNATSPLFGAVVAHVWLRDRLSPSQALGLLIGFAGVVVLVWGKASFQPGGSGWAILAALGATLLYGIATSFAKKRLAGVNPLAIATGSQLGAALALLPFAIGYWPPSPLPLKAWLSALALGVACTGVAYVLYFRLLANLGPTRAISVTFLIPVFGMLWGGLFIHEAITINMLVGGGVILVGTALTIGLLKVGRRGVGA